MAAAAAPVDLEIGPGGDLYYVDILGGTIRRIRFTSTTSPPIAAFTATPQSGHPPLAVTFDAHTSSDPDAGDVLSYAWDFTNDGTIDATGLTASYTYAAAGSYTARVTVDRQHGPEQLDDAGDRGRQRRADTDHRYTDRVVALRRR